MDKLHREIILTDCIEQLQAGETVADCRAKHGAEADAVAPLLSAAARLQRASAYRLTDAQRSQGKATLRTALRNQQRAAHPAPGRFRFTLPGSVRGLALAGSMAFALFVVVSVTAVAASQPGDLAYPVRVLAERAPVLLKTTAAAKTATELRIADRRLADLEAQLAAEDELAFAAVQALLAGDQAAADRADALSPTERLQAASQVTAHATTLTSLAQAARRPAARETLRTAATQAEALAQRLRQDGPGPAGPTETPAAPAGQNPPPATATPYASSATPSPAGVQSPLGPGRRATALAQTATPSPEVSTTAAPPSATGQPGAPVSTPAPGRRATALAQTPTQPAQPTPAHTPGPGAETPAPGRRATALAQTPTQPAQPPPAHTPGPGAETPVPGRRATALAQTPTIPAGTPPASEPTPTHEPDASGAEQGAAAQPQGSRLDRASETADAGPHEPTASRAP